MQRNQEVPSKYQEIKITNIIINNLFMFHLTSGEWQHWSERVPEYTYPIDSIPEFKSILVPNVDNVRTNFLIDVIAKQSQVCSSTLFCIIYWGVLSLKLLDKLMTTLSLFVNYNKL